MINKAFRMSFLTHKATKRHTLSYFDNFPN